MSFYIPRANILYKRSRHEIECEFVAGCNGCCFPLPSRDNLAMYTSGVTTFAANRLLVRNRTALEKLIMWHYCK
jgi:hypothetical protein